jgi:prolipoprotein diacylglyceryltransferase
MSFPVNFDILGRAVPAHVVFELAAYVVGFQTYLLIRRRGRSNTLPAEKSIWLIVGCVFGAFVGSKILAWLESAPQYWAQRHTVEAWLGGKTIVGGILGGWIGVEVAKRVTRVAQRTGDAFVLPLILGIAIGRFGCFLTGLADHTHGTATALPWAVDFGDGVPRHPTQLYEIALLLVLGVVFVTVRAPARPGDRFRWFIIAYMGFRFLVEFIKPRETIPHLGLSVLQIASLVAALVAASQLTKSTTTRTEPHGSATVATHS